MSSAFPHGACALPHWGVLRARGADAASFLHTQLTQDVTGLALSEARLAGYCSPKGRLLATFVVWREAADDYLLACSADVLPAVLKRLRMFVLRAKCTLDDASAERPLHGVIGAAASRGQPWQRDAEQIRLPDVLGQARALWIAGQPPALPALPLQAWQWLEVHAALPIIVAATAEQFVPQMVNLEAVGGVNFQKGCYPGQEVVARSQYRGSVKRRAFVFQSAAPAQPGQEIFSAHEPEQPAGMVVNAASWDGEHAVFAEVKLAALAGAALHLGAPDGPPLRRSALPYALPALDAA
jgi:folate-binding protein YgfZ